MTFMPAIVSTLLLGSLVVASPLIAKPRQSSAAAIEPKSDQSPAFVPADFNSPTHVKAAGFQIVPLGPNLVNVDFDAYMSSIDPLQKTFSRSSSWPRKDISQADAMRDMKNEQARFRNRESFAYAVLTPDGSRELGSLYVSPSPVGAYDSVVKMWVTKDAYNAGFDAELFRWVTTWMKTDWPFRKIAYPGRSIDWKTWDSLVAAGRPRQALPGVARTAR
jgi:hypothetical protein